MMRKTKRAMLVLAAAGLGACSMPDTDSMRFDLSVFKPRSTAALRENFERPIGPEDYVDPSGGCSAAAPASAPASPDGGDQAIPPAGTPLLAGGVALHMTECEVVRRLGAPERVEVSQNDASERTAMLTYLRGERPGIYQFVAGRLKTIERTPEAAPQRPTRPQRPARKSA